MDQNDEVKNARQAIGKSIERERLKKGISQSELAQLAGTTQSHISRIEKGKYNFTFDTLNEIAKSLNCYIDLVV